MSTPRPTEAETIRVPQDLTYNWSYDDTRDKLMRLYDKAQHEQWIATERLDWSIDVDPHAELVPDRGIGIYGTPMWDRLTPKEVERLRHEVITWQMSQFLHGEQGALLATAQLVDSVPWYEGKQYGATQVMDEARHVEVFRRFLDEKLEHRYPVNPELKRLLDSILSDSRWDVKFLGMQVIVEGLALAVFHRARHAATNELLRDLYTAVLEDETRHVAFGVVSLREYYEDLPEKDRAEREDYVFEAMLLMRDRMTNRDLWEAMGMDPDACFEATLRSKSAREYRKALFSRVVPNVKSLGLLSDRQRARFAEIDILKYEDGPVAA